MKNCLFVGSFNPITKSHIEIAKDLLNNKIIDYLYFLPVNSNKKNLESISYRINMINLVIDNRMNVLNIYNYSKNGLFDYLILDKISKEKDIKYLVLGSDLFLNFSNFKNYETILKKYKLIIINRNNIDIDSIIINNYSNYKENFYLIKKEYRSSSTKARESLHDKDNIYLDKKVLDYIKENKLYN